MPRKSPSQEMLNTITPNDVVIAVMGPTGAGKSTFISLATGNNDAKIGHSLRSCTDKVEVVRCYRNGKTYVFLDTPGFDDTTMTHADILTIIISALLTTYKGGIKLAGLIYLHRISDNRMTLTERKTIDIFKAICGPDALHSVILATSMWDEVGDSIGSSREAELRTTFWESMISSGSRLMRFMHTSESAWEMIDQLNGNKPSLQIQVEMVDERKSLPQTAAGNTLFTWFNQLVSDLRGMIKKLRTLLVRNRKNPAAYKELQGRLGEEEKRLGVVVKQKRQVEPQGRSFAEAVKGATTSIRSVRHIQPQATEDETLVSRVRSGTTSTIRTSSSIPLSIQTNLGDRTITTSSITKPSPIAPSLHHPKTVRFSIIEPPDVTENVTHFSPHPVAGGGFSSIYTGEFEQRKVAIKVIRVFDNHRIEKIERRLAREMDVWWSLNHPNVVPLLGYVSDMGLLPSPVSQWYKNGDAARYIRTPKMREQPEMRMKLLRDVSAGLRYLHHQDPAIVHGDLKPANILIDDRGTARLCDFGLARVVEDGEAVFTGTVMCTVRYAAPELSSPTQEKKVAQTTRTDIYSLACVGYEFLYLKRPYATEMNDQAMVILSYKQTPPASRFDEDWHPFTEPLVNSFWRLLESCWNRDEARRPDIDQFYNMITPAS